jgi:hypothetical protein
LRASRRPQAERPRDKAISVEYRVNEISHATGASMPTSLPERRQPEFFPSPKHIVAIGVALAVIVMLAAYHARFKAWVSDALRAELVIS